MEHESGQFNPLIDLVGSSAFTRTAPAYAVLRGNSEPVVASFAEDFEERSSVSREESLDVDQEIPERMVSTIEVSRAKIFFVALLMAYLVFSMGVIGYKRSLHPTANGFSFQVAQSDRKTALPHGLSRAAALPKLTKISIQSEEAKPLSAFEKAMMPKSPLVAAIIRCDKQGVKDIIDSGGKINAPDQSGNTPLVWSIKQGCHAVTALLLLRGANTTYRTRNGYTAWNWAQHYRSQESVRMLQLYARKEFDDLKLFAATGVIS